MDDSLVRLESAATVAATDRYPATKGREACRRIGPSHAVVGRPSLTCGICGWKAAVRNAILAKPSAMHERSRLAAGLCVMTARFSPAAPRATAFENGGRTPLLPRPAEEGAGVERLKLPGGRFLRKARLNIAALQIPVLPGGRSPPELTCLSAISDRPDTEIRARRAGSSATA